MKVLITGASGQVGAAVARLFTQELPGVELVLPTRTELDLERPDSVRAAVRIAEPRWIVSCGAYTGVDAAESHPEAAHAANAVAPGVLADEGARNGAGLIHFSTDYVFNGSGQRPWLETDPTGPLNVYGSSKLLGEEAIAAAMGSTALPWAVLRTSWVYSGGGKNFVRTMLRLLSTRTQPLRIVDDQHGAPTAAADLAAAALAIVRQGEAGSPDASLTGALLGRTGVYHCAGTGETTWAGLAGAVREYLCLQHGLEPPAIVPVTTADYPTPAERPLNSRLNCNKLATNFGVRLPHWRSSVADALRELTAIDLQPAQSV